MRHIFTKDYLVKPHSQEEIKARPISSVNLGQISHVNNKYGLSVCIVQNSKQLDAFNAFNDVSINTRYFIFTYPPNEEDKMNADWFGHGYFIVIPEEFIRICVEVEETTWDSLAIFNDDKKVVSKTRADTKENHNKQKVEEPKPIIIQVEDSIQEEENVEYNSEE